MPEGQGASEIRISIEATLSDVGWRALWAWLLKQSDEDQEPQQRQDETQPAGHDEDGVNGEGPYDR